MTKVMQLARVQLLSLVVFIVFKLLRKPALAQLPLEWAPLEGIPTQWVEIFLYSFPNFLEPIVGAITITYLLMLPGGKIRFIRDRVAEPFIYIFVIFLAAVYVLTQEFKIHNLGGNNIYDPNDVLFSIAGLAAAMVMLFVIRPKFSKVWVSRV